MEGGLGYECVWDSLAVVKPGIAEGLIFHSRRQRGYRDTTVHRIRRHCIVEGVDEE